MENNLNSPQQILEANISAGKVKSQTSLPKIILLGLMAGAFIAFGASSSNVAVHSITDVGLARTLAGSIFPVGLMLIVLIGGELFTGDCLMITGFLDKKYPVTAIIRVLITVFISNFVGSLMIVLLVANSGQYDYTGGLLGAYTIKVALGKVTLSFGKAFISGILCNILVCLAVLMASTAKDIAGKIWAIFFPILAFVLGGYEHCVANMYYIPAGIVAAMNPDYVVKAQEAYGYGAVDFSVLTWSNFTISNLIPVTLGNIVGGMVFVGLPLFLIHKGKRVNKNSI